VTIFFNLALFVLDLMALEHVRRFRTVANWRFTMLALIMIDVLAAGVLAIDHFDFIRYLSYVVFLHGSALSIGSAVILWKVKKSFAIFLGVCPFVLGALCCHIFLIEPFWLEVSYRRISSPKISRAFRIVVLADLQTDRFGEYERGVFRRAMEEKPDLILLAGDYIQAPYERYGAIGREINGFLREIDFGAPYGVFAVQGNVDPPYWHDIFTGLNVTLVDVRKTFDLGALRLTCLGLGESYHTRTEVGNSDPGKFHLVLGHVPNFALGRIEGDLLVAGHTHGGQVRIPIIGPIITHARVPNAWTSGLTLLPSGAILLASRGIGMERGYAPRMRFFCRPELVVIDLVPDDRK
jgi:uncharacterized protein